MPTSAVDAVEVIFNALPVEEQEDAYARLTEARLRRLAGEESTAARMVRSLRRVAEHVGRTPTVDDYRAAQPELAATGEDVESFSRLYRFFGRSWSRAVEALALSDTTTPRRIEARFRYRKLGKVWRYTEQTLASAAAHYGRAPSVAEFEHWRERELELARARGDDTLHLPSPSPYRKRWKTWDAALRHIGHDPAGTAGYLEGRHA